MAYIGREPQIGNYQVCDAISVVNAQAAYTMQVNSVNVIPESVNHMIVSLNGVIQKPGSSYTISSSTITFSSNLATGDSIDFIYLLGNTLDLGTPSDDTVTGAKIVDNAINSEHYTDASIDLAHMSDNSIDSNQYVDGSIDTAHIADAQITVAKMAANSIDSDQYVDGSIDTAHIAADQITAAKIADNAISEEHLDVTAVTGHTAETSVADGDTIIIHDASASALRKMTKANFVGDNGSMVLIKTVTASNVSSVVFDHGSSDVVFDTTYKSYLINVVRAYGATDNQKLLMKARVSGSNSSSNFRMQIMYNTYNGSSSTNPASAPNNDKLYQNAGTIRNSSPEYFVGQFYLYGIGESTRMSMTGQATYKNNSGYLHNEAFSSGSDANETTSGIEFTMASGNIYGTFSLYGLVT